MKAQQSGWVEGSLASQSSWLNSPSCPPSRFHSRTHPPVLHTLFDTYPEYYPESRTQELFPDGLNYLAGDVAKAHPGVSVKSTVLLLKKKDQGRKKKKRCVLLSLCGYEALRWPLWAVRGKAFWACMGLTVQLGRE